MAEIKSMLDDVIEKEIENLDSISSGDEAKSQAIRDLVQLHKLRIEEIKAQTEAADKQERREMDSAKNDADRSREEKAMKQQARENKIDRLVRTGVNVAELVLPLICYGVWMGKGFEFEKTGSFTSTTFKNLLNRFRPTK